MIDRRALIRTLLSEGYIVVGREDYEDPSSRTWMLNPVTGKLRFLPKGKLWDTPSASRRAAAAVSRSVSILTKSLLSDSLPQTVPDSRSAVGATMSSRE